MASKRMVDREEKPKIKVVPDAAFPFCGFRDVWSVGALVPEYNEVYCNSFQVNTFWCIELSITVHTKNDGQIS